MAGKQCLKELHKAAELVKNAKALVVTAGAGMGVDSGLPDFRGPEGLWRAYPPLKDKGLRLEEMSTPHWFVSDPAFAWGFFGHRYNLYKETEPNKGFEILRNWGEQMAYKYFVYTSNVDGHFQKAGFDSKRILECHGRINYLQSIKPNLYSEIWPVDESVTFDVDMSTLRCKSSLPMGPPGKSDTLARPNILMFNDWLWISDMTDDQETRYKAFVETLVKDNVTFVVIEIGAGVYVPTIRYTSEGLVRQSKRGSLVRINPRDTDVPSGEQYMCLPMKGLEALQAIKEIIDSQS